jgi:uncharacterized RmlC-like cupin family protein
MLCVGFEPTIPASERVKTVYVLDRSATMTGKQGLGHVNNIASISFGSSITMNGTYV